jgi:fucose permease
LNNAIDKLAPAKQQSTNDPRPDLFPQGHLLPFILVTALFFIWGMSNQPALTLNFRKE